MQDQSAIWDHFQTACTESFAGAGARLRFLAKRAGSGKVLNIGVGDGAFERFSQAMGAEVISLDPSARALSQLASEQPRAKWVAGLVQQIPFASGSFDSVVASELFEHLSPQTMDSALCEIHRVLKREGRILGTVPAREKLERSVVVCPNCGKAFHRWGHQQSFDVSRIRTLLARRFQILNATERCFVSWDTLNWKGKPNAASKLVLSKLGE